MSNKTKSVALYPYLLQYGVDRFKMILIKEYQVADALQLRAYEQLAISRTKTCCNERAALALISSSSMAKHYRQVNKQAFKNYYQTNKQAFKEYRQTNKQHILQRDKEYRQANKDVLAQKASTRVMCECGTESSKTSIYKHRKTVKHARLLAALNAPTQ